MGGAKLRPLAWTKLRGAVVAQSLWADIKGGSSGVRVDPADVIQEFSIDKPKPRGQAAAAAKKKKKKQSQVQHLLDSKRSTNLSIVLSRFKIPNRVIQLSIWCLDEAVLEEEDVAVLLTATPTQDEEALLKGHAGNGAGSSGLGRPEQYLIAVMAIPRLASRLVAWHYMITFPQKLTEISQQVDCLRDAIGTVMSSSALVTILAQFLATGNFLNEGSFRGGALGVKIGALTAISDCKQTTRSRSAGKDSSRNLSHILAGALPKECAKLVEEFSIVSDARKVDYRNLSGAAEQLAAGLGNVKEELRATDGEDYALSASALSSSLGKPDALPGKLKSFTRDAGEKLETILSSVGQCGDELLRLCCFFELPSPKVVQDCAPFAAELLDSLDNFRGLLAAALKD